MGTYSIVYYCEECSNPYAQFAADWDWNVKGEWARSEKDGPGGKWVTSTGLDEKARQAILRHFGLEEWGEEFPIGDLIFRSPKELAATRRRKESECGLLKKEMRSDTLGYHVPAEMHS